MSLNIPGFALQPSATRVPTATNYMTSFDFLNQYHWIIEEDVESDIEDEQKILTPEILGHAYERSVVEWEKSGIEKDGTGSSL